MMRIAIIGLGMAAGAHIKALEELADRVEISHAFSPSEERRAAAAANYGLRTTGELDAILSDPSVAGLLILTPPNTHLELIARAARAGKDILLEKPLEVSAARARACVDTAAGAGVKLGVVLQNRYRRASEHLATLIAGGRLGRIVSACAHVNSWRSQSYYDEPGRGTKARDGGGVLLTQAIHTLDQLLWFAGDAASVCGFAMTSPMHRMETEDVATAVLRFRSGAIGAVTATTCAYPGTPERIEVIAERGTAVLSGGSLSAHFLDGAAIEMQDAAAGGGFGAQPMAFSHEPHRRLLEDFFAWMRGGPPPRATAQDALRVQHLIEALITSASVGGAPIELAGPGASRPSELSIPLLEA